MRGDTTITISPPAERRRRLDVDRPPGLRRPGNEVFTQAIAADVASSELRVPPRTRSTSGARPGQVVRRHRRLHRRGQPGQPDQRLNGQANASQRRRRPRRRVTTTVANTRLLTLVGSDTGNGQRPTGRASQRALGHVLHGAGVGTRTSTRSRRRGVRRRRGDARPRDRARTSRAAVNIGQSVALAPLAADGSGTLTTPTSSVAVAVDGQHDHLHLHRRDRRHAQRLGRPRRPDRAGPRRRRRARTRATRPRRPASVGVAGQTITVSGHDADRRRDVHDHLRLDRRAAARAPPRRGPAGAQTWQAQQRSSATQRRAHQPRRLALDHDHPRRGGPDRAHRPTTDLTSGATRVPHRDDPGRRRQHRHLRQLHSRQLHEAVRRGHGHRHRHRDRAERRRDEDDHRRARRLRDDAGDAGGLTTGTLGAFTVVHGAATRSR